MRHRASESGNARELLAYTYVVIFFLFTFSTTILLKIELNFSGKFSTYCILDRDKTGASKPRGGCARDFVNFREKFHASRAGRGRVGLTVYPPRIQIADVATPRSRPDHRKSKFGLGQGIKLIELYALTKSEF